MAVPGARARGRLADLGDRCLVHRVGNRFTMLETVRQFATERLEEDGRAEEIRRRHGRRMLAVAEEGWAQLRDGHEHGTVAAIEQALPDLRAAFGFATAEGDADAALRMVVALRDCAFFAMLAEPLTWGEAAGRLGLASGHPLVPDALAIAALGAWGAGDLPRAERLVREARAVLAAAGREEGFTVADAAGTLALAQGRPADALEHYRRAVTVHDGHADRLFRAEDAVMVAACLAYLGETDAAVAEADRILRELVPGAGPLVAAWCWYGAGEVLLEHDPGTARERLAVAEDLARRTGARFVLGVAGTSLASVDARHGDPAEAIARYRWLLPLWVRAGVRTTLWTMLRSVVELLARLGSDEAAARLLGAVTGDVSGVVPFGIDDTRLEQTHATLRRRLGDGRLAELLAEGRRLDDAAAAAVAAAAFDER
jgi:tetratricopeptide (TPR) repeat protein